MRNPTDRRRPSRAKRCVWTAPALQGVSIDDDGPGTCGRVSGLVARHTAAGPDGIRGSAARQMDELKWLASFQWPLPNPVRPGSPSSFVTLASQRRSGAAPTRLRRHRNLGRAAIGLGTGQHRP
jgi:hypothetical protein